LAVLPYLASTLAQAIKTQQRKAQTKTQSRLATNCRRPPQISTRRRRLPARPSLLRHCACRGFPTPLLSDKAAATARPPSPQSSRHRGPIGLDLGLRGEGFWKPPPRWRRLPVLLETTAPSKPTSPTPEQSCSRSACGRSCASSRAPPTTPSWYGDAARRLARLCALPL
jgi:hypothetical protein